MKGVVATPVRIEPAVTSEERAAGAVRVVTVGKGK